MTLDQKINPSNKNKKDIDKIIFYKSPIIGSLKAQEERKSLFLRKVSRGAFWKGHSRFFWGCGGKAQVQWHSVDSQRGIQLESYSCSCLHPFHQYVLSSQEFLGDGNTKT